MQCKSLLLSLIAGAVLSPSAAPAEPASPPPHSEFGLANGCYALRARANGAFVAPGSYRAGAPSRAAAAAFYMQPTGLGTYLLYDADGGFLGVDDALGAAADQTGASIVETGREVDGSGDVVDFVQPLEPAGDAVNAGGAAVAQAGSGVAGINGPGRVGRLDAASARAEWAIAFDPADGFRLKSTANGRSLAVAEDGSLVLADAPGDAGRFRFLPQTDCARFPEAELGASGEPFAGTDAQGNVRGFVDAHLHVTAHVRAGGRVIHGRSFDRFGIQRALDDGAEDHGPQGTADVTGNLLRTGTPVATHDTEGWPGFPDWPVADTLTHQQVYYVWLKRAWMAGMRLIVAQTVADEVLCQLEPLKAHGCEEGESIRIQIRRLHALQDYIDAQNGGPGKGWFRIVTDPGQARRVIEDGKLAVVIGIESSKLFDCGEFLGEPECSRADIDRGIDAVYDLGVRSLFITHWVDNAFAGAGLEGGAKGQFINIFNKLETGHYFRTEQCPEEGQGEEPQSIGNYLDGPEPAAGLLNRAQMAAVPTYPSGPQCNAKGLTELGEYLVRRLMDKHMLIEADHLSEKARNRVLAIAQQAHYPLVSSHTGTGGAWTQRQLRQLYAAGGLAFPPKADAPDMIDKLLQMQRFRDDTPFFGVGFGTDTGGFSSLPGAPADAGDNPLEYPFTSFDGRVTFQRQRTGDRIYDLNTDGVAHYGLFADLIADMQRRPGGDRALGIFFSSAEAYLRMWRRAVEH